MIIALFEKPYIECHLEIRERCFEASDSDKAFFLTTHNKVPARLGTRSVELLVKKLSTAYGKSTTPHKLRHTLATRLYGQTKDSLLVSQQLGHRGTAMIELYVHVAAETTKEALFSNAYIH
ncbi:tyrosine-type recombinase/integrase [Streptococcus salivarius]